MTVIDGEDVGLTLYLVSFVGIDNKPFEDRIIPAKDDKELELFLGNLIRDEKSRIGNRINTSDGIIIFKIGNLQLVGQGSVDKFSKSHNNPVAVNDNEINKDLN